MDTKKRRIPKALQVIYLKLHPVLWGLYGVFYWLVLALQILLSVSIWQYTVTYDYFCGNPLMGAWSSWFLVSLMAGLILLPGGVWAWKRKGQLRGIIYGVGFLLYIVSMLLTFLAGLMWGTTPDFILFPPW